MPKKKPDPTAEKEEQPSVPGSLKFVLDWASAVGIKISPQFVPILIIGAGFYYFYENYYKPDMTRFNKFVIDMGQVDPESIKTRITSLEGNFGKISTRLNEIRDGFWIPISTNLQEIMSSKEFMLPLSDDDVLGLKIIMDKKLEKIIGDHLKITITGTVLPNVRQFINRDPLKIEGKYIKKEVSTQDFVLDLADDFAARFDGDPQKLKEFINVRSAGSPVPESISILLVVSRTVFVNASKESVPPPEETLQ